MRADHLALVKQCQLAGNLQNALNDEHDVWTACIIFVKNKRRIALQRIGAICLPGIR